jgi:hypothetical protein
MGLILLIVLVVSIVDVLPTLSNHCNRERGYATRAALGLLMLILSVRVRAPELCAQAAAGPKCGNEMRSKP